MFAYSPAFHIYLNERIKGDVDALLDAGLRFDINDNREEMEAIGMMPSIGNAEQKSSYMGDEDNPSFNGGGKLGKSSALDFNDDTYDFAGIEKSDGSDSTEEIGHGKKRKSETNANVPRNGTKKKKCSGKKKDEKSSEAAKKREFSKFRKWFDNWMCREQRKMPGNCPAVNGGSLDYRRQMVQEDQDMDEYTKKKLLYVLNDDNSDGKTDERLWWMTVKSLGKVPRGVDYERNNDCPVCKVAKKTLIDLDGHDCEYCHACFHESGWKKNCKKDPAPPVLLKDCKNKEHRRF